MSEELKEIVYQLKDILNKYPRQRYEILKYVFGKENLMRIIEDNTLIKLEQENQRLKEDLQNARSVYEGLFEIIDKAIKFIEDSYYSMNTTDIDKIAKTNNRLLQVRNILKGEEILDKAKNETNYKPVSLEEFDKYVLKDNEELYED